jgi:hypothetical protein
MTCDKTTPPICKENYWKYKLKSLNAFLSNLIYNVKPVFTLNIYNKIEVIVVSKSIDISIS